MKLNAKMLAKHGMRRSAYDGANKRRFVLFITDYHNGELVEWRHEFHTESARDNFAIGLLTGKVERKGS